MKEMTVMNNVFILFILYLIFFNTGDAQVRAVPIPDEAERNHLRTSNTYDDAQRLSEVIEQEWLVTGAWGNHRRFVYTYTDEGRTVRQVAQFWEDGMWNLATRETKTYRTERELTSRTRERRADTDEWVPEKREIYVYNENNQLTELQTQKRADNNSWQYDWRFIYIYDDSDNIIEKTFEKWGRNGWEVASRIIEEFDADGNRTERVIYEMRDGRLSREKAFLYDNDGDKMIRQTMRRWTGTSWQNIEEERYEYDNEDRLLNVEYYEYHENNDSILVAKDVYNYDDEETVIERIREHRQPDGSLQEDWKYVEKYDYRGYRVSKSYHEWQNGRWVEQHRTTYTYDIYGNKTSSLTQR